MAHIHVLGFIIVGGETAREVLLKDRERNETNVNKIAKASVEVFNPKTRESCLLPDLPAPRQAGLDQSNIIIRSHTQ